MFGGAYYIWIMLTFFVGCGGVLLLIAGVLWVGHRLDRKETGAKHGFLELPHELREGTTGGDETRSHEGAKPPPDHEEKKEG
jgi:hypothetical protein